MSASHLFLDCDSLYDLAALDLLDYLVPAFVGHEEDIFTLRITEGQIRRVHYLSSDAADRAVAFVQKVGKATCVSSPGKKLSEMLADIPTDMENEALLYACAAEAGQSAVVTGDKRSIVALLTKMADPLVSGLAGRVLLTETVLLRIHSIQGWDFVVDSFYNAAIEGNVLTRFPPLTDEATFISALQKTVQATCSVPGFVAVS